MKQYILIPKQIPEHISLRSTVNWVLHGQYPYLETHYDEYDLDVAPINYITDFYAPDWERMPFHNPKIIKPATEEYKYRFTEKGRAEYNQDRASRMDKIKAELFLALSTEKIRSYGILDDDISSDYALPLTDNHEPIPSNFWRLEHIREFAKDKAQIGDYTQILLNCDDLFKAFPQPEITEELAVEVRGNTLVYMDHGDTISNLKSKRTGRPPSYNWPEFHAAAAIIAVQKNIPTDRGGQAQLEKLMADWCSLNWSEKGEPAPSMTRGHCKPVFEAYKAGKLAPADFSAKAG